MKPIQITLQPVSVLTGALLSTGLFLLTGFQGTTVVTRVSGLTGEQEEFLEHVTMVDLDDGQGGLHRTARIEGINVQIVSGSGATDGPVNGLGNLIVGYNELGNFNGDDRTGSHNIVCGDANSHSSYGGLVVGTKNMSSAPYAMVGGGFNNIASGYGAAVTGGAGNLASGQTSAVSGGVGNEASGLLASISAGNAGLASGDWSSIAGGTNNTASGRYATVSGGGVNVADGLWASITGGRDNTASGHDSTISGGRFRTVAGDNDWAAGALFQDS